MSATSILTGLQANVDNGYSVILDVKSEMFGIPNGGHGVTFLGNYRVESTGDVSFDVQSWGEVMPLTMSEDEFEKNYNGAVWGRSTNDGIKNGADAGN
ncbi:MAG: hypothetical protein HWE22_08700 [Flavobacteriales bacterium]|nr:hypothetical protein [Flavobacteriales bacterium]